ncbi:HAD-IA family hydrolase [Nocardia sp. NPDC050697]|uniref:HAD family hydrolase n=1 Tax=Nocardia sp. NPDC050697 TaxID=3155158 RepID=UPI00340333DA
MVLRAVIFDFDGLILDTETPAYTSWQETYTGLGAALDRALWAANIGTHGWDAVRHLEELVGHPVDRAALRAARLARHHALIADEVVRPGVVGWLDEAKALGLAVGLASSSGREWVGQHLERLGLLERFAVLATGDRVPRPKPDPAVYRLALDSLDIDPADAIAVEDSANGVAAAKAAGLRAVAVPNAMTAELDFSRADLVLRSLTDAGIAEVAERLGF